MMTRVANPALVFLLVTISLLPAKLNVVTTSTDLKSIALEIGQNLVKVTSLTQGEDSLHTFQPNPTQPQILEKANLLVMIGAGIEAKWLPGLLAESQNSQIIDGQPGQCNLQKSVKLLQRQYGETREYIIGIHPVANPHYWTDPINGIRMAKQIASCLSVLDPKNKSVYFANFENFRKRTKKLVRRLLKTMKKHRGRKISVFHAEFEYLANRFGLKITHHVEAVPGRPPGIANTLDAQRRAKKFRSFVMLTTPWNNTDVVQSIANISKSTLLSLPIKTNSTPKTGSYLKMISRCIFLLDNHLSVNP